ncbi:bifunctional ornithine acetyltransferase/N-acetylglutamate synthase [Streptomyces sp. SS8]
MTHDNAQDRGAAPATWPTGFRAYSGHGGLREHGDDISIVVSDRPATSAAMFTQSLFADPAVVLSRTHAEERNLRAVTTLAQNANVATGRRGEENAAEIARRVAQILGVPADEVLIGSTGVIGRPLPMDAVRAHFDEAARDGLAAFTAGPLDVARAMMTTDTRPKTAVHGADPNWGRVLMAVGKNTGDTDITPGSVTVRFGDIEVHPEEAGAGTLGRLSETTRRDEADILITLGLGEAEATVYGCDLSAGYIRVNADCTT